jgi:23S rRNA (guanosine2251-2'-O)-methyltransferase
VKEWIVGRNPVFEVLRANRRTLYNLNVSKNAAEKGRLADIIQLAEQKKIHANRVSRNQIDVIASNHQGVALEVSAYPYLDIHDILTASLNQPEAPFLLILDTLQDPQNLGTLLRTAEIVGVHGILLPLRRTATITPAVVTASSGACEYLKIAQVNLHQAINLLQEKGIWVIGLEGSPQAQSPTNIHLTEPLAFVVGSEGRGMRPLVRKTCDILMRLPMRGQIESLNAAVAGSVALYLAWQARDFASNQN